MTKLLEKAYNPVDFRKMGHEIVDLLSNYLESTKTNNKDKVLPWKNPDDMLRKWEENFQNNEDFNIKNLYADFLKDSIHIHNPN